MNAEKLSLTTDAQGWITGLPQFEPNQDVELIVLFAAKKAPPSKSVFRTPPAELFGKIKILSDIIVPAVPEDEWDRILCNEFAFGYSHLDMVD